MEFLDSQLRMRYSPQLWNLNNPGVEKNRSQWMLLIQNLKCKLE